MFSTPVLMLQTGELEGSTDQQVKSILRFIERSLSKDKQEKHLRKATLMSTSGLHVSPHRKYTCTHHKHIHYAHTSNIHTQRHMHMNISHIYTLTHRHMHMDITHSQIHTSYTDTCTLHRHTLHKDIHTYSSHIDTHLGTHTNLTHRHTDTQTFTPQIHSKRQCTPHRHWYTQTHTPHTHTHT